MYPYLLFSFRFIGQSFPSIFTVFLLLSQARVPTQSCFHVHKTTQLSEVYIFLFVQVVQLTGEKSTPPPLSAFLNVTLLDTTSNLAHIKLTFFMKPGRRAPFETRCEMSRTHRCQGCAITFGPRAHRRIERRALKFSSESDLCHRMLCDSSNFPGFMKNSRHSGAFLKVCAVLITPS